MSIQRQAAAKRLIGCALLVVSMVLNAESFAQARASKPLFLTVGLTLLAIGAVLTWQGAHVEDPCLRLELVPVELRVAEQHPCKV